MSNVVQVTIQMKLLLSQRLLATIAFLIHGSVVVSYFLPNFFLSSTRGKGFELKLGKHEKVQKSQAYGPHGEDFLWESLRRDAAKEAAQEPILASFLHASVLSQPTLERSLAFHLSNLLASPAMISTQLQALFLEASENSSSFRDSLRLDILAVKTRDPAVKSYTDIFLYFKGFHALQTHRVAHWLWKNNRQTLALFLHSRANAVFQIDIHPGARLGTGILIDHGTGVVIGETAIVGDNVSMLHKVTLGGTGLKTGRRHPTIGDGVLLGAGSTLLGPIKVGHGANIGASSMVIGDVPDSAVAVGVPAKIILRKSNESSFSPALTMETNALYFDI
eukprot:gene624-669_t